MRHAIRGAIVVTAICVGTVAWAAAGTAGGSGCGCDEAPLLPATAGTGSAVFAAADGALVRADAHGTTVRRNAIPFSARSGPPPVWLAAGDGRVWASARGAARAFSTRDLSPVGPSLRPFPGRGLGPIAVAGHAVWGIERFGGSVRGVDPRMPGRVWNVAVGRGTTDLAAGPRRLYVALARTAWGGRTISRDAARGVVAIDVASHRVSWRRALGFDPLRLAAGPSGVWAAGAHGDLVALAPQTGRVRARTRLGGLPDGLAATAGGALVTIGGAVTRVALNGALTPAWPATPSHAALAAGGGGVWLAGAGGALTRLP